MEPPSPLSSADTAAVDGDEGLGSRSVCWQQLCDRPLLYHCEDFLTEAECDALIQRAYAAAPYSLAQGGSAKFRVNLAEEGPSEAALLRSIGRRVAALTAVPLHPGEMPWAVHFTPAADTETPEGLPRQRMSLGLHVDSNNARERRWVTFIAYLRSTPPVCGGNSQAAVWSHTPANLDIPASPSQRPDPDSPLQVFPLALRRGSVEPKAAKLRRLRSAAEVLLEYHVQHTGAAFNPLFVELVPEAAEVVLAHAEAVASGAASAAAKGSLTDVYWDPSGTGLALVAKRGSCVAFFTRAKASQGLIDPRSWHGGAAVFPAAAPAAAEASPPGSLDQSVSGLEGERFLASNTLGKWTLQKFREVPEEALRGSLPGSAGIEAFAREHSVLLPSFGGGVRCDVEP